MGSTEAGTDIEWSDETRGVALAILGRYSRSKFSRPLAGIMIFLSERSRPVMSGVNRSLEGAKWMLAFLRVLELSHQ